jgi:hypothetical protein
MRANALVLCVALLSTGCASVSLAPSRSGNLRYNMPRGASGLALTQPAHEEHPHTWMVSPLSIAGDVLRGRKVRRIAPRDDTTGAASGGVAGGTAASASQVRVAVLEAVDGVKDSTGNIASALSKLAARPPTGLGNRGLSGTGDAFTRFLEFGSHQLPWLRGALGGTTAMVDVAEEAGNAESAVELFALESATGAGESSNGMLICIMEASNADLEAGREVS